MPAPTFTDLDAFVAVPRVTALALSPDGNRLIATVAAPDAQGSAYTNSLWAIDPAGGLDPVRLTFSAEGESGAAFLPDGALLFVSDRPDPQEPETEGKTEDKALWRLPPVGEATVLARTAGGLSDPAVDPATPVVVLRGSRLAVPVRIKPEDGEPADEAAEDEAARKRRKETKASGILHDGMPVRSWDSEVGETSPRLFRLDAAAGDTLKDLAPDAGLALHDADVTLVDGRALCTWTSREQRGLTRTDVVTIDLASGTRRVELSEPGADFSGPRLDPTGSAYAVVRRSRGTFETPHAVVLQIHRAARATHADLGDLHVTDYAWSADGAVLFVAGDLHGAGAILAVDAADGRVLRRLAADAVYSELLAAPDGRSLFALRSALDHPPVAVRLDVAAVDQEPTFLRTPGDVGPLPGRLARVEQQVGEATVSGWLCLPAAADAPAPLMTWVHGGPFGSWNSWSWRWCPWVAVARGYAVLLPDPALSTGYGAECIARAWPHRAAVVWREVEALTDRVLHDPAYGLDAERTGLLGASFGGYMTNWIAGHTDRFRAIVTHAGLWALDQQHATTDMAAWKTGIFGRPAEHPEWYAENSPDRFVDTIRTPMLVVHGNRDYRVPVSEALRLWWDLLSRWDGAPEKLPHRFLQFTGENHWVLNPSNAVTWYRTVLDFCAEHMAGISPTCGPR